MAYDSQVYDPAHTLQDVTAFSPPMFYLQYCLDLVIFF